MVRYGGVCGGAPRTGSPEFVREVVDRTRLSGPGLIEVAAPYSRRWGVESGIEDSVLDGICGHAAKSVGGSYGEVSQRHRSGLCGSFRDPQLTVALLLVLAFL